MDENYSSGSSRNLNSDRHRRRPLIDGNTLIIVMLLILLVLAGVYIVFKMPNDHSPQDNSIESSNPSSQEISEESSEASSAQSSEENNISLDNSIPDNQLQAPETVGISKVKVIATGGTIAGIATSKTAFSSYTPGIKPIADMVGELSGLSSFASVTTQQFANQSSSSTTTKNLYDLSLAVDAALEENDSVVVTCGTDIMEEIAYFLDLTVQSPKPVVVTGSMRPWNVIGSDAPINLYNAIKVAASNKTYKFGTVVVLNDEIHAAREVTKGNSHRADAFETPMLGMLGYVDENDVTIYRVPTRAAKSDEDWATPFDLTQISASDLPKVEIVVSYQGAGGEAIEGFVKAGAKGIVTAGTGNGGISQEMLTARNNAMNQGVFICATTRTGSGTMYSEDRDGYRLVSADNLNAYHARIALQLCLAYTSNYNTIQNWFDEYIRLAY